MSAQPAPNPVEQDVEALNQLANDALERGEQEKALEYFKKAAGQDLTACLNVGLIYHQLEQPEEALTWYQKAHEGGQEFAAYFMAVLYMELDDRPSAIQWYRVMCDRNDPVSQFELGSLLYSGEHTKEEGFALITKAAEQEEPEACNCLGAYYAHQKQEEVAEEWFLKAAKSDLPHICCNVAYFYESKGDKGKAHEWYAKSADLGDREAQYTYATLLEDEGKLEEALVWYQRAADQEEPFSMNILGIKAAEAENFYEAERLFLGAACQDYPDAMCNLARLYHMYGQEEDALNWYSLASGMGHEEAKKRTAALEKEIKRQKNSL